MLTVIQVHRESSSGDAVQLNMIHGTHFMASSSDVFPDGKMWGPWLWYLVCITIVRPRSSSLLTHSTE